MEGRLTNALKAKDHILEESRDVEAALNSLMERKRNILQRQKEAEKVVKELEENRGKLKESSSTLIKHQQERLAKVQEDLKHVRQELDLVEGRKTENSDLENFMARQIEELTSELECPVCLEVATKAPIFKCSEDHLVCRFEASL